MQQLSYCMAQYVEKDPRLAYDLITCPHFQVAERTLFFWNNDYIVKLINQNRHALFPIIIGALYKNSKQHWNSAVHGLTFNVLKLLVEAAAGHARGKSDREASLSKAVACVLKIAAGCTPNATRSPSIGEAVPKWAVRPAGRQN